VRISREDEGVDPQLGVLEHPARDRLRIAHQCRPGAAADQADSGPQVGAHLQAVTVSAVQGRHPALPLRLEVREGFLRGVDGRVVEVPDEILCRLPGRALGLSHDDVYPQPETQRPPVL